MLLKLLPLWRLNVTIFKINIVVKIRLKYSIKLLQFADDKIVVSRRWRFSLSSNEVSSGIVARKMYSMKEAVLLFMSVLSCWHFALQYVSRVFFCQIARATGNHSLYSMEWQSLSLLISLVFDLNLYIFRLVFFAFSSISCCTLLFDISVKFRNIDLRTAVNFNRETVKNCEM
jgi:hypothetical protein